LFSHTWLGFDGRLKDLILVAKMPAAIAPPEDRPEKTMSQTRMIELQQIGSKTNTDSNEGSPQSGALSCAAWGGHASIKALG